MKYYFELQFRMLQRNLSEFGLQPLIAFIVLPLLFIGGSAVLFSRTPYAAYFIVLVSLYVISLLGHSKRNTFLKTIFSFEKYRVLRLVENLILALPFSLILLWYRAYWSALLVLILASLISVVTLSAKETHTLITPFSAYPFEFTVGFRNSFLIIVLAYFLTIMGIKVDNFNLGVFSLMLIIMICSSYYFELEDDFYIWIHRLDSKGFLLHKLKVAMASCSLLCLPIFTSLILFYPKNLNALLAFQILGLLYLILILMGKYALYPLKPNVPQAVLIGMTLVLPPLLIFIIPYFFLQSVKRLKSILP